ncbi:MAG TPA: MFS transporter [Dermatophilaceae bacterium]|nr:MFS transporter [Dermatophilaceae bacterium]
MTSAIRPDQQQKRSSGPMGSAYRLLTVALLALVTIIAFENMAISTAMPAVAKDLDAVRSYGLAFSFMLTAELLGIVLAGVWADRRGPLPSLYAGQLLMAAGSGMAGLAPTFAVLLAGRLLAGLGGGLIVVALYVVIGRAYPDALRPKVFSWVSAAWVLPSLVGPPVAGWVTSTWSWRWVFLLVIAPIAVTFAVVSTQRDRITGGSTAEGARPDHSTTDRPADKSGHRRLALLGLGVAVSAGAMQWGSTQLSATQALPVMLTVLGLAGIAATAPRLVPPGTLLMSRGLPSVMMSRFLLTASFNGALTFIPLMLVNERHVRLTTAGIMLTVGALGWSFGSFVQGHHALNNRRSELVVAGGASLTAGILLLAAIAALGWPYYLVGLATALSGLGMGLAMSSISVLSLALSPVRDHGRTSSSLQVSDVLGAVMGISVAGAVFAAMHNPLGSDIRVYELIWLSLAAVSALVMVSGQRTRT